MKTPQTSQEWWNEISQDKVKIIEWLKNQYHGERSAARRITTLRDKVPFDSKRAWRVRILDGIIVDEVKHAVWVGELLVAKSDVVPQLLEKEERYWEATLPPAEGRSFEYLCAVGHLAEDMRLERIRVIAAETREEFKDIATVFQDILPDEEFHAELFRLLSTPEAIEEARTFHEDGMNALGLVK